MSWETLLKMRKKANFAAYKQAVKEVADTYEVGTVINFTNKGYDVEEFLNNSMLIYAELTAEHVFYASTGKKVKRVAHQHAKKVFSMTALGGRQRMISSILLNNGWERISPVSQQIFRKVE
tara:strand:- start:98 stop:460 length:363 start_codon:yes stop_codon:yes gene_type:complete